MPVVGEGDGDGDAVGLGDGVPDGAGTSATVGTRIASLSKLRTAPLRSVQAIVT